eukprot:scaffold16692_cov91-Isochrysis_galbana.AAC.4
MAPVVMLKAMCEFEAAAKLEGAGETNAEMRRDATEVHTSATPRRRGPQLSIEYMTHTRVR